VVLKRKEKEKKPYQTVVKTEITGGSLVLGIFFKDPNITGGSLILGVASKNRPTLGFLLLLLLLLISLEEEEEEKGALVLRGNENG
jgi:hypothetical protein